MFVGANLAAMFMLDEWMTVPFHFIWISITLLYGWRLWSGRATWWTLTLLVVLTAAALFWLLHEDRIEVAEVTEVPLMAAVFAAMAFHVHRRMVAEQAARAAAEREVRFLHDASHELRTPLTIARSHADFARDAARDPAVVADIDVVVDELEALSGITARMLTLAAAPEREFVLPELIDLSVVVRDVLARWQAAIERRWRLEADPSVPMSGDQARIESALDCLLDNAVRYTTTGDAITVRCRGRDDVAVLEVEDTGDGIGAEHVSLVFDRFYRAEPAPGPAGRRTSGLGLAIVQAVAEGHGGSASITSRAGEGTCVRMAMPAALDPPDAARRPSISLDQR